MRFYKPGPGLARRPGLTFLCDLEAKHRLHLEIFLQPEDATFAAIAGLLVTAERRGLIGRRAVEIDPPGADACGNLLDAVKVAPLHVAG